MTSLDSAVVRPYLQRADLKGLFNELGWDRHVGHVEVEMEDQSYRITAVAEKRGVQIYECAPCPDGRIPERPLRQKIHTMLAKSAHEHLIVFVDAPRQNQVWQWVLRQPGHAAAYREHAYRKGYADEALIQKLNGITFSLDEEDALTLTGVTVRVKDAFDKDPVTKRFYDLFKKEHDAFQGFLDGIPDGEMQRWYVSVMLNRLMFIYFIQKKGFLDGDQDYLCHRLDESERRGRDRFYLDLLCPLFFQGFAEREAERTPAARSLLGRIPYLNGGLFQRHQIEELHGQRISIPDAAFRRLFDFFDGYQWHLDDRPLQKANEINPDVLGYIFEKYINQKEMGAYYSKEDITGYISRNTVVPFLFDAAREKCRVAFDGEASVWRLLQADPDRYIYTAMKRGGDLELPPAIAAGLGDVSKRGGWNRPAPAEYALPTEIWREVVARLSRYREVRGKLEAGEVCSINDLITYNLDIVQFAQDVISTSEGPELLRAFWQSIEKVTVLDPTCGSGAFLFAALNLLEPLYETCLERMEAFLGDLERSGEGHRPEKYSDFKKVLAKVAGHVNRRYFVLKSIVVSNLYGVDLMEEAVEICKLRLFLKLVAQLEPGQKIEPLPDIDFNIKAGNTLVGYATYDQVKHAVGAKMDFDNTMGRIEEKAGDLDRLFARFREQQTELGVDAALLDKSELRRRLGDLDEELDHFLATEYKVKVGKSWDSPEYRAWHASHRPFHWFLEFYGTMKRGGFDVIIGNPPYVEYTKVTGAYEVRGYSTLECSNLYALVLERSLLLNVRNGRLGMIVPISLISTPRMNPAVSFLLSGSKAVYISNYSGDAHPAILFSGVKMRLSIVVAQTRSAQQPSADLFATRFIRWYSEGRESLFSTIAYAQIPERLLNDSLVPKLGAGIDVRVLDKILAKRIPLGRFVVAASSHSLFAHRIVAHFVKCFDFIPYFRNDRDGEKRSEDYKVFSFSSSSEAARAAALLNSTTFYYYYLAYSDAYHCGRELILRFPCGLDSIESEVADQLASFTRRLMIDARANAVRRKIQYHGTGWIGYDEFYPRLSKPIIDEIDRVLAKHYGFTDEELDFIINYDIKYRMGRDGAEEE